MRDQVPGTETLNRGVSRCFRFPSRSRRSLNDLRLDLATSTATLWLPHGIQANRLQFHRIIRQRKQVTNATQAIITCLTVSDERLADLNNPAMTGSWDATRGYRGQFRNGKPEPVLEDKKRGLLTVLLWISRSGSRQRTVEGK
jgi:hypothetical protein